MKGVLLMRKGFDRDDKTTMIDGQSGAIADCSINTQMYVFTNSRAQRCNQRSSKQSSYQSRLLRQSQIRNFLDECMLKS